MAARSDRIHVRNEKRRVNKVSRRNAQRLIQTELLQLELDVYEAIKEMEAEYCDEYGCWEDWSYWDSYDDELSLAEEDALQWDEDDEKALEKAYVHYYEQWAE